MKVTVYTLDSVSLWLKPYFIFFFFFIFFSGREFSKVQMPGWWWGGGKGILKLRIDRCISYPLLQHSLRARSQETVKKNKIKRGK